MQYKNSIIYRLENSQFGLEDLNNWELFDLEILSQFTRYTYLSHINFQDASYSLGYIPIRKLFASRQMKNLAPPQSPGKERCQARNLTLGELQTMNGPRE